VTAARSSGELPSRGCDSPSSSPPKPAKTTCRSGRLIRQTSLKYLVFWLTIPGPYNMPGGLSLIWPAFLRFMPRYEEGKKGRRTVMSRTATIVAQASHARLVASAASARARLALDPTANERKNRSKVTNGKRLFVEGDKRGPWSRRFSDILGLIVSDLGGPDVLSEGQRQLARRATTLSIACEKLEGELAQGRDVDLETYGQMCDRLGRCFNRLGLKRQAKDITPSSLGDLIRLDQERQRQQLAREREARREQEVIDADA
jgi:hypothetical protein